MKLSSKSGFLFERLITYLPDSQRDTFTSAQLDALRQACLKASQKQQHAIDVRLPVPFPGRGFYLVILAGRERRSVKRLRAEHSPYQTIMGLFLLALLSSVAVIIVYKLLQPLMDFSSPPHATAIPWLQTQAACEQTSRIWRDEKCWDDRHSPDF